MKKTIINRLLAGALSVFALTACTSETNEGGLDGRTPLTVSNSSIAESRATDNAWENKAEKCEKNTCILLTYVL